MVPGSVGCGCFWGGGEGLGLCFGWAGASGGGGGPVGGDGMWPGGRSCLLGHRGRFLSGEGLCDDAGRAGEPDLGEFQESDSYAESEDLAGVGGG
jgi:hypothetical protein